MKHIQDILEIRKINKRRYEIVIKRIYIDCFGKEYVEIKLWDFFASKSVAERSLQDTTVKQALKNCGYKV